MDLFLLSSVIDIIGNNLYHVIQIYFLMKKERQNIKVKG